MGQRHQVFLIARLLHKDSTQPRYRCVAAVHHQWLYGRTALNACKAILELLRNKENAQIVREELAAIAATYSRDDKLPSFAAPFVSWLFSGAGRLRLEEQYVSSSICLLDANMGSHEEDNNEGITVLDITNPLDPAYCFVSIGGRESDAVEPDIPLTAEQYVREYDPPPPPHSPQNDEDGSEKQNSDDTSQKDEDRKWSLTEMDAKVEYEVLKLIKSFVDERLVELWMLHEAWPYDGYEPPPGSIPKTCDPAPLGSPEDCSVVPTLSELSLRKAIDQAQEYGDISGLEVALLLPGIGATHILHMLAKLDHYSDVTVEIIVKALRDARSHAPDSLDSLDLSPYALTPDQIVKVSASFPHTQMLKLSGNPNVDGQTLSRLLQELPTLSRLNVYNCDAFSPSDIDALLSFANHLEVIYHRKSMIHELRVLHKVDPFAEEPLATEPPPKVARNKTPPAFTFYAQTTRLFPQNDLCAYSLKSYSPRQIVVCLHDFLESLQWIHHDDYNLNTMLSIIISSLPRPPHVPFKDRTLGPIPGNGSLAIEGGLLMMAFKEQSDVRQYHVDASSTPFVWGFVKYCFANLKKVCDGGSSEAKDSARPPLESIEVMGLAEWLQKADPDRTVEGEWVERLEEKLKDFELISKERAIEQIKDIPMYTE